jgi:hypothetical protein
MADLGFKDYMIHFLLVGLFVIGLVSFGVSLGGLYGVNNQADGVNMSKLEYKMDVINNQTTTSSNSFLKDNPFMVIGGFVLTSIWGIIQATFVLPYDVYTVLSDGLVSVLNIPKMVIDIVKLGW